MRTGFCTTKKPPSERLERRNQSTRISVRMDPQCLGLAGITPDRVSPNDAPPERRIAGVHKA
jgi:hypothetical protein